MRTNRVFTLTLREDGGRRISKREFMLKETRDGLIVSAIVVQGGDSPRVNADRIVADADAAEARLQELIAAEKPALSAEMTLAESATLTLSFVRTVIDDESQANTALPAEDIADADVAEARLQELIAAEKPAIAAERARRGF